MARASSIGRSKATEAALWIIGPDARGDLVVALAEPEARRGQVAGDRDDAAGRRGLHAVQDGAQPRVGLGVVGGAHEAWTSWSAARRRASTAMPTKPVAR